MNTNFEDVKLQISVAEAKEIRRLLFPQRPVVNRAARLAAVKALLDSHIAAVEPWPGEGEANP